MPMEVSFNPVLLVLSSQICLGDFVEITCACMYPFVLARDAYNDKPCVIICVVPTWVVVTSCHFLVYHTCVGGEKSDGMPYPPMFVWLRMLRILLASDEGASGASSCVNCTE